MSSSNTELLERADQLQLQRKVSEVFDLLSSAAKESPEDPQILWRLARAHFDMADEKQEVNWKKDHYTQGLVHAEKALKLVGDFIATKEKIANAYKIKEHAMKALELKAEDPTTLHLLGRWCVGVASIGWIERKLAATLFGTPPESSYEEALGYFLKAAELEPKFLRNMLCIGDCYYQLKQYDNAKTYYQKAADLPAVSEGDKAIQNEAKTKLSKL